MTAEKQPETPPAPAPTGEALPTGARLRLYGLVAAMALGSVVLWLGIPAFWVFLGAQISSPGTPTMAPLVLVLVATPISMVIFAPLLGRLDHAHRALRGSLRAGPRRADWNKSMRDSSIKNEDGVLERVMIASVVFSAAAAGVYLSFFGTLSMPS